MLMKKTDQLKSTIVTVSILGGVVTLGSLGYIMMFGNKKKKRAKVVSKNEKEIPETSVEPSRQENMNDVDPKLLNSLKEVKDVNEVMKAVSITLLKSDITTREDFLKEFVRLMWKITINPKWFDYIPKEINGLEELLKKNNLYEKYKEKVMVISNCSCNVVRLRKGSKIARLEQPIRFRKVNDYTKNWKRNNNRIHNLKERREKMEGKRSGIRQ